MKTVVLPLWVKEHAHEHAKNHAEHEKGFEPGSGKFKKAYDSAFKEFCDEYYKHSLTPAEIDEPVKSNPHKVKTAGKIYEVPFEEKRPHLSKEELKKFGPTAHKAWANQHKNHFIKAQQLKRIARKSGVNADFEKFAKLEQYHWNCQQVHEHYFSAWTSAEEGMKEKHKAAGDKIYDEIVEGL